MYGGTRITLPLLIALMGMTVRAGLMGLLTRTMPLHGSYLFFRYVHICTCDCPFFYVLLFHSGSAHANLCSQAGISSDINSHIPQHASLYLGSLSSVIGKL